MTIANSEQTRLGIRVAELSAAQDDARTPNRTTPSRAPHAAATRVNRGVLTPTSLATAEP